ncbi:MAG: M12 family metallo-peptidase, partial [Acidimicrobiales bacterium]
ATWLGGRHPVQPVTWRWDIDVIRISVAADPNAADLEALWRDPAMAALGYGSGLGGVRAYAEDLRRQLGTDWAYVTFFTKYPTGWFAYASVGGPRLVMQYDNDGWGPDNIDRVFAHETGHIFNAPDEYASSNCNCGGTWGYYGKPNANCANCAPGGGVSCIMRANTWDMCLSTPYHLGFPICPGRLGVQFRGNVPASSTRRWFTHSWPADCHVVWSVVPTTVRPGAAQIRWDAQVERASPGYITYWISITNMTATQSDIEARYAVLGST